MGSTPTWGTALILGSRTYRGSEEKYRYSAIMANNVSFNMSPFRTMRIRYHCNFASEGTSSGTWSFFYFIIEIRKANSSKTLIKEAGWHYHLDEGGPEGHPGLPPNICDFDISDVNEQAFVYFGVQTVNYANVGNFFLRQLEFLN